MTMILPVPTPTPTDFERPFWEAAARGALALVRCTACAEVIWYPRPFCPNCAGRSVAWFDALGTGTVYTFTIARKASAPFDASTPYVIAYVELTEGPRILTNLVGVDPDDVTIGMPVEVTFDTGDHGFALHRFRPRA